MTEANKVRAIIIDAHKQEVREEWIENSLQGIYRVGGFDIMCSGLRFENEDTLWIDDEGLLKDGLPFFVIKGQPQALAGNGVITGADEWGDTVDAKTSVEDIRSMVTFLGDLLEDEKPEPIMEFILLD